MQVKQCKDTINSRAKDLLIKSYRDKLHPELETANLLFREWKQPQLVNDRGTMYIVEKCYKFASYFLISLRELHFKDFMMIGVINDFIGFIGLQQGYMNTWSNMYTELV